MPNHPSSAAGLGRQTATCPTCGAAVPVLGRRWLAVHQEGSPEYFHPRGVGDRCPGSLLHVSQARGHDR